MDWQQILILLFLVLAVLFLLKRIKTTENKKLECQTKLELQQKANGQNEATMRAMQNMIMEHKVVQKQKL